MKNKATFIFQTFQQMGVELNPSSRLAKQVEVYLDRKEVLPQIIEPGHAIFQSVVEAYRDINQIAFSLKHLLPIVQCCEMKKRLRRLVADNVLPQDSPEQSPGRDAQFEFFVAALCARAKLEPVFNESPDLRCRLSDGEFGVAVKRIKVPPERFERRFERLIHNAVEQIEKSGVPGVIIADISQSLNPRNWRVPMGISDSRFDETRQVSMTAFRRRFEQPLFRWTRGKRARGAILIDHIVRCTPNRAWQMELSTMPFNLSISNQRRRREFELFDRQFRKVFCDPGEVGLPQAKT